MVLFMISGGIGLTFSVLEIWCDLMTAHLEEYERSNSPLGEKLANSAVRRIMYSAENVLWSRTTESGRLFLSICTNSIPYLDSVD